MFGAIGRLVRTIGYFFTGRLDKISAVWRRKPEVIKAEFDSIIKTKSRRIMDYKNAIGEIIAEEFKKTEALGNLSKEIKELNLLREGALAKGQTVAKKLGNDIEKVKSDPDYIRCLAAHRDFSKALEEKTIRATELEAAINGISETKESHKIQLQSLMKEVENIKSEKNETVADIIGAEHERQIADMLSGISEDKTHDDLLRLREMRSSAKAQATISKQLSGLDVKRSEQEFLEFATAGQADTEFDRLIGLASKEENPASTDTVRVNE